MTNNTEISKLRNHFDLNQVSYELVAWGPDRFNIHVKLDYLTLSFLTSIGSYGGHNGLIEYYNFRDEPDGYLTAKEAIDIYERVVS